MFFEEIVNRRRCFAHWAAAVFKSCFHGKYLAKETGLELLNIHVCVDVDVQNVSNPFCGKICFGSQRGSVNVHEKLDSLSAH